MSKWKRFCCWMGWHSPDTSIWFDECSFISYCKCGKRILQDSVGNWFHALDPLREKDRDDDQVEEGK